MPSTCIAIVQQADYSASIHAAVQTAIELAGGLPEAVRLGATVLLKPNLLSPRPPEDAVTTHPAVVEAVIRHLRTMGVETIWLGDSCAGSHTDEALWESTGMARVAEATGAALKSFNREVSPRQVAGQPVPVPAWLSQVDAVISIPKMKTHALTGLTCAMKNTYGLIAGSAKSSYHGTHPSPRSMSRFLVDVYKDLKPDFFIVDAIDVLEGEGTANGHPRHAGLLLAGGDGVAIDTVCARMLKGGARQVPMLAMAEVSRAGIADPADISLVGDGVNIVDALNLKPSMGRHLLKFPEWLFKPATRLLACHPKVDQDRCIQCGICAGICSQHAISRNNKGRYRVDGKKCILCMCCSESCPKEALPARSPMAIINTCRSFFGRKK